MKKKQNFKKEKSIDKDSNDDMIKAKIKNFQEILKEYNVTEPNLTPKMVLDKMTEHLEYYIKIVIQLLQPEEFHSLQECTMFDDKDKAEMFEIYKNMMILHREMMKSHVRNDDKDIIATIQYAHSEMKKLKPQILKILQKMQESWKITGTNGKIRYFG